MSANGFDKERLPQWGWLAGGLVLASVAAGVLNLMLYELGLPRRYDVVTTIALMTPVLIYVGIWYDEERQPYWEYSRIRIVGDLAFVVVGAALGAAIALVAIDGFDLPWLVRDVVGMTGGFVLGWGLFWWRNTDLFGGADGTR